MEATTENIEAISRVIWETTNLTLEVRDWVDCMPVSYLLMAENSVTGEESEEEEYTWAELMEYLDKNGLKPILYKALT